MLVGIAEIGRQPIGPSTHRRYLTTMQRNDLITLLAEQANDPVSVSVSGFMIDVYSVAYVHGHIVLVLDPNEIADTLKQIAAGDSGPGAITAG